MSSAWPLGKRVARSDKHLEGLSMATDSVTDEPTSYETLLIPADVAGPFCGVSAATWWRMHAAGKNPAPVKCSHRTLWRRSELAAWVEASCPDRRTWEALRSRKGGV
jgi:predicted DNA-binding transcriptional regulator AlpA